MMVPQFLKAFEHTPAPALNTGKKLIIIQLSGGNDGLNTVIPYRNDIYYKERPKIGIAAADALRLDDETGINPWLKNMKALYDAGDLAVLNGVGYPHPDRSHFRSMDIWQSASASSEIVTSGWIGRYLDACGDGQRARALEVDDTLSLALKGEERSAIAVRDINQFHRAAANDYVKMLATHQEEHDAHLAGYLYRTLANTTSAADYIFAQSKLYTTRQTYPDTQIGKRLKTIGQLINARTETSVYYVSHGSFDTHVNQADRQNKLLGQLDDALAALVADLKDQGTFNDVLVMTFSEFGRRLAQNASNGTDHGTASCMFLIGGGLKKRGMLSSIPSLEDLDEGDLKYTTDFRNLYATILDNWLNADAHKILGRRFDKLSFV